MTPAPANNNTQKNKESIRTISWHIRVAKASTHHGASRIELRDDGSSSSCSFFPFGWEIWYLIRHHHTVTKRQGSWPTHARRRR